MSSKQCWYLFVTEITTDSQKSNILWCETGDTPFHQIPVVPIRFSGQLKHTLFSPAYSRERMKGYMDSLNMMYVAFTRAKDVLIIGIPNPEKKVFRDTGDLLRAILDHEPLVSPSLGKLSSYQTGGSIQVGEIPVHLKAGITADPWKFDSYPVDQRSSSLRVRLRSDEYFVDEDGSFSNVLSFGTMMHQVFSRINSPGDVEPLLNEMQKEGLIPANERAALQVTILEMINQPGVEGWFSTAGNRSIYNERNILCGDGRLLRPDRVIVEGEKITVVDFKFGTVEKSRYVDQVLEYMLHLETMGYRETYGFVWYVTLGKTIEAKRR